MQIPDRKCLLISSILSPTFCLSTLEFPAPTNSLSNSLWLCKDAACSSFCTGMGKKTRLKFSSTSQSVVSTIPGCYWLQNLTSNCSCYGSQQLISQSHSASDVPVLQRKSHSFTVSTKEQKTSKEEACGNKARLRSCTVTFNNSVLLKIYAKPEPSFFYYSHELYQNKMDFILRMWSQKEICIFWFYHKWRKSELDSQRHRSRENITLGRDDYQQA